MYDSMSLSITMSDLYDCGVQDDLLVLLNEVNINMKISINTSYGLTEPVIIPALVAQGDLFAPLQAAVQVDSMTRRLEEQDLAREEAGEHGLLYKYKGKVTIPSLGLMDDNLTVSEAGFKADEINIFMNENSATKLLQFNTKKCKYLRMGKPKNMVVPTQLEVDSWVITYDDQDNLVETEGEKVEMQEETEIKYLGFVISGNASNVANILEKKMKSIGTIRSITNMIKGLETFTIKNGLIYLNSLLRSSILYAGETYYNLSEKELRMVEMIEEECLSKILNTGRHCPRAILYLETGHHPARFQIFRMMLNFLKYILDQEKNSLVSRFFIAQKDNPIKGDWVSYVMKLLKDMEINLTLEDIEKMKRNPFKKIVNKQVQKASFKYLISKIKSKGKEIRYGTVLKCQGYLMPNSILTLEEQLNIFSYRARMNNLQNNFPGNKIIELCKCGTEMSNEHLYECNFLNNSEKKVDYSRIFEGRLCEMKYILNILEENKIQFEFTQAQNSRSWRH